MPRFIVSLTLLVVLSTAFAGVFGLRCFECNTSQDKDPKACADPMKSSVGRTTCPNNNVCVKVSYTTQNKRLVTRGCGAAGNTCHNLEDTLKDFVSDLSNFKCSPCNTDLCNGGKVLGSADQTNEEDYIYT